MFIVQKLRELIIHFRYSSIFRFKYLLVLNSRWNAALLKE